MDIIEQELWDKGSLYGKRCDKLGKIFRNPDEIKEKREKAFNLFKVAYKRASKYYRKAIKMGMKPIEI